MIDAVHVSAELGRRHAGAPTLASGAPRINRIAMSSSIRNIDALQEPSLNDRTAAEDSRACIQSLQDQRRRGFRFLCFEPHLEGPFRGYMIAAGRGTRCGLAILTLILHLLTPLYYMQLLDVPSGFIGYSYALQYGLQFSAVAVAGVLAWRRPFSKYTHAMCVFAFLAVVGGMLAQRSIGAAFGFEVPSEFAGIAIAALLILGRLPFWSVLPWTLLASAAVVANEWLFVPSTPAGNYHVVACLMLFGIALLGGYSIEYFIRWSWLNSSSLKYMSRQDGLTGLLNRKALETAAVRAVEHARRSRCAFAVAMIDIDYFKAYNDAYGHQNGDSVICQVADKLRDAARRPQDFCGRYGGEEFALLWRDGDYDELCTLAEQLRGAIEHANIRHRSSTVSHCVTVSIGLYWVSAAQAVHPVRAPEATPVTRVAQLLDRADELLYKAKSEGRNRVVCARATD